MLTLGSLMFLIDHLLGPKNVVWHGVVLYSMNSLSNCTQFIKSLQRVLSQHTEEVTCQTPVLRPPCAIYKCGETFWTPQHLWTSFSSSVSSSSSREAQDGRWEQRRSVSSSLYSFSHTHARTHTLAHTYWPVWSLWDCCHSAHGRADVPSYGQSQREETA